MWYKLLIISVLFIGILTACNRDEDGPTFTYNDFEHLDHWDDLELLTEAKTIIYYYSPFCDICIQLEEPVTKLLNQIEPYRAIYLADDGYLYGAGEPNFELFGVPALIILKHGTFHELVRGSRPVLDYLENEIEVLKNE